LSKDPESDEEDEANDTPFIYARRGGDLGSSPRISSNRRMKRTQKVEHQSGMNNESECWTSDPNFLEEGASRAAQYYMNFRQGGKIRRSQEKLDCLVKDLRSQRVSQHKTLEEVAEAIGIEPAILCLLENGWGTIDEFLEIIGIWSVILECNPSEYKKRLEGAKEYETQ
jgi:hypothetical protein